MIDRRTFLATLAAAGLRRRRPVWRLGEGDKLERIGVQLYTVRASMQQDVAKTLESVAGMGFKEVEFAGYFGRTPREIKLAVGRAGLTAPGAHVPYERLGNFWNRTLDDVSAAGHELVVVPWIPEEARKTDDDWARLADLLNRSGHAARAAGLRFAYHNQEYDFKPAGDAVRFDRLAAATDPDAVAFELDIYWAVKGGADPLAVLDRYPGRFPAIHAKDAGPAPELKMTEVGKGTVDWRAVLSRRGAAGFDHVFIEHDEPANPYTSLTQSLRYLRRLDF